MIGERKRNALAVERLDSKAEFYQDSPAMFCKFLKEQQIRHSEAKIERETCCEKAPSFKVD